MSEEHLFNMLVGSATRSRESRSVDASPCRETLRRSPASTSPSAHASRSLRPGRSPMRTRKPSSSTATARRSTTSSPTPRSHVFHSRSGAGGIVEEDVTGVIATSFTHFTSRADDPQLH